MIVHQVRLRNVGVFAGDHTITLAPARPDQPVVLIGARNGCGKTTLLQAVQLALYGARAGRLTGRTVAYDTYLAGLIHRQAPPGEQAAVEVEFSMVAQGRTRRVRVCRSWRATRSGVAERLLVATDDNMAGVLADDEAWTADWADRIEALFPSSLAPLFFFDGEKIEALADPGAARAVLKTAVHGLLGVDVVDQTVRDLRLVRRRHTGARVPESVQALVAARHDDLEQAAGQVRQAHDALDRAERDHARARERAAQAEEAYRLAGGERYEQRRELEDALADAQDRIGCIEQQMRQAMFGAAPLLAAAGLLADTVAAAAAEVEADTRRMLAAVLPDRDAGVLATLASRGLEPGAVKLVAAVLEDDRAARCAGADAHAVVGWPAAAVAYGRAVAGTQLPAAAAELAGLVSEHARMAEQMTMLQRRLEGVPAAEAIAAVAAEREQARAALRQAADRLQEAQREADHARRMAAQAQRRRVQAQQEWAAAQAAAESSARIAAYVPRAAATLALLRQRLVQRRIGDIETQVADCLRMLLAKTTLVAEVRIDPDTFEVRLVTPERGGLGELPMRSLSAGERQLLAVALLWGMARASRQDLPVMIDTPLSRLDTVHRANLLRRYFPAAGRQVVLLATDSEIDARACRLLAPHVGRAYRFDFDEQTGASRVREGYFSEVTDAR